MLEFSSEAIKQTQEPPSLKWSEINKISEALMERSGHEETSPSLVSPKSSAKIRTGEALQAQSRVWQQPARHHPSNPYAQRQQVPENAKFLTQMDIQKLKDQLMRMFRKETGRRKGQLSAATSGHHTDRVSSVPHRYPNEEGQSLNTLKPFSNQERRDVLYHSNATQSTARFMRPVLSPKGRQNSTANRFFSKRRSTTQKRVGSEANGRECASDASLSPAIFKNVLPRTAEAGHGQASGTSSNPQVITMKRADIQMKSEAEDPSGDVAEYCGKLHDAKQVKIIKKSTKQIFSAVQAHGQHGTAKAHCTHQVKNLPSLKS